MTTVAISYNLDVAGALRLDNELEAVTDEDVTVDLADVYMNNDRAIGSALDRCKHVSLYLLDRAPAWLGEI